MNIDYSRKRVGPRHRLFSLALVAGMGFTACRCNPKPEPAKPAPVNSATQAVSSSSSTPPTAPSTSGDPAALESEGGCPAALAETRRGGAKPNLFVAPTDAEMKAMKAGMAKILKGDDKVDASSFGMEIVPLEGWPDAVLVREAGEKRQGRGAYVIRKGSTSNFVVQAPHTFYDEGTFPIACDLFQRTKARALFINTVHRYKGAPETGNKEHPADVAHAPITLFQAGTEGLIDAVGKPQVIQVHGFADRKLGARAVVSVGEKKAGNPLVAKVAKAVEEVTGPRILKYPEDTKELGATTNVQGAIIRRACGKFLHIEMDDNLRRDLVKDAAFRGKMLDALWGAFSGT
jgi:hypothetical protein